LSQTETRIDIKLPPYFAGVGCISLLLAAGVLALGLAGDMGPTRPGFSPWAGLIACFGAGGLYLLAAAINWRVWVKDEGLQLRNALRLPGPLLAWSDIRSVTAGGGYLEVRGGPNLKIRAPLATSGLDELLQFAAAHGVADAKALLAAGEGRRPGKDFF
jgi:hypothetical protein